MKRLMAMLCCAVVACGAFSGCTPAIEQPADTRETEAVERPASVDEAILPFNREDTLDPYAARTQQNVCLSTLLYDSLVTVDGEFVAQNSLAVVEQTDATHLTATLKKAAFSDGSTITAADVTYSFQLAKASENYKTRLSNVKTVTAKGNTLTFTLETAQQYAAASLSFPIVKQKTATDKASAAPIGSGPYVWDAKTETLVLNPQRKQSAAVRSIKLYHAINSSSVLQALENGSVQYMYNDLSDGNIPRTSVGHMSVDLPHLVYIGVNGSRPLLNTAAYRQAISAALDRTAISAAAYTGRALAATSPFHPLWKYAKGVSCMAAGSNTSKATTLIKDALAVTTAATENSTTVATQAAATTVTTATTLVPALENRTLTLIYPSGNSCREAAVKMIVSQLSVAGITVISTPLSYEQYMTRLKTGDFDLYLGEIRLSPDMRLSALLQSGGTAAYGVSPSLAAVATYTAFQNGSATVAEFVTVFGEDMPYIPICWRQGMVAVSDALPAVSPTAYNLYKGFIQ